MNQAPGWRAAAQMYKISAGCPAEIDMYGNAYIKNYTLGCPAEIDMYGNVYIKNYALGWRAAMHIYKEKLCLKTKVITITTKTQSMTCHHAQCQNCHQQNKSSKIASSIGYWSLSFFKRWSLSGCLSPSCIR